MCADHGVWHEGVTPSPQGDSRHAPAIWCRATPASACWRREAGARCGGGCRHRADPLPGLINLQGGPR
ncbi:nicotinate-nucleotide--dimethylbenzimidazole phosphoribosyltransferase [Klebsiella pneumoniae]|nr:nicotinate-nucleotide--dimethylbenzimidazole phosphoribosyltransferase [Klebsiella pneumoniae]